jgi:putative membrane protein
MATQPRTLREAAFNPRVVDYWLLSGAIILAMTIVGIPLAILWYLLGRPICLKILSHMGCTLTTRNLQIRKGWLNRVEKTIPLEKITDLAMFQGPIMRAMNLKGFRVETAGSGGAGTGYLVSLIGIEDTDGFRAAVLEQRDLLSGRDDEDPARPAPDTPAALPSSTADDEHLRTLRDIHATLERIEHHLTHRP